MNVSYPVFTDDSIFKNLELRNSSNILKIKNNIFKPKQLEGNNYYNNFFEQNSDIGIYN